MRHVFRVFRVGLYARFERRVRTRNINVGVERIGIKIRIGMRLVGGFAPEKVFVDLRQQIVVLEFLTLVKLFRFESRSLFALRFKPRDLLFQTFLAPIGKLAVEFVLALRKPQNRDAR